MSMADRIKERRLAMGLTQEELAQKVGLQKSAIAKYENGRVENIKRSIVEKMAVVLDCTPSYLMGFDEETVEVPSYYFDEETQKIAQEIFEDKNLRVLFDASRGSSAEDLQFVTTLILELKKKGSDSDDTGC